VVLAASAAFAAAASPEGPRLAVIAWGLGREVISIGSLGKGPVQVVNSKNVGPSTGLTWSAAGDRLAFPAEVYPDDDPVLGVVDADGGNLRIYPRIRLELTGPVMAPDGRSAAFARVQVRRVGSGKEKTYFIRTAIWSFDFQSEVARPVTRWRDEYLLPSSYLPDGSTLAATGYGSQGVRALSIDLGTGHTSLLAHNAAEPVYAPDGSSFAFVRRRPWLPRGAQEEAASVAEVRVGRVAAPIGSISLLRMRGLLSAPSWDPSGRRLAIVHSRADQRGVRGFEKGDAVLAINADGTCRTKVFSDPRLTLYSAAWQPGLGREAGPIAC
jgi:Tol biopolymer transport system component